MDSIKNTEALNQLILASTVVESPYQILHGLNSDWMVTPNTCSRPEKN